MNIQIFGTKKCNDTKKAERFFKERGIKYQFIDMKEKGMSKGEFTSVAQANGGLENMVNWEGKDQDTLALIKYIAEEDKLAKVLEQPRIEANRLHGLPDCYKIKLRASGYRLVYQVQDERVVVFVVAVGKREREQVYLDAGSRMV